MHGRRLDTGRCLWPSPLVGEGGAPAPDEGTPHTPHPPSGTFSHKGRRPGGRFLCPLPPFRYSLFAPPHSPPLSPALAVRLGWRHPSAWRGSDELPAAGRGRGGVTYARRHCPFRVRGVGGCRGRPATGPVPHGWRAFRRQGHPLRARFNSSPAQWRDRGPSTAVYRPGPRSRRAAAHPPGPPRRAGRNLLPALSTSSPGRRSVRAAFP